MQQSLSTLDLWIIIGYFIIVLIIGVVVAMKTRKGDDLFLGGRSLTWGFIGLSLFASNISSTTLIGLSGAAYSTGIVQSIYEWGSGLPMIVLAVVFVPVYLSSGITTIPEFLAYRYDRRSRVFFSITTIVISIVVDTAGGLYAGAIVLQLFFPDLILWQTCFVLAIVAGLYTAFGGLKAVVYTDALQAIVLIAGCSALTYILFSELDFSWSKMVSSVPSPDHFSTVRGLEDESMPWPGLILAVPFLGFWYWATNQYITQRVLGAKDINHARWGVLLGGFLKILPFFVMVLPGAMAISLYPDIAQADLVFPTLVMSSLPNGLIGLVLAGLIAAIMSSVDSTLNSASTLVVVDFVKEYKPDISEKQIVNAGRIVTLIFMVVAAAWAPNIANFGGLWSYLQQMFSIIVPPVVVIFIFGVFSHRVNGDGAFRTLIIGTVVGVILFVFNRITGLSLHYSYNVGISLAISVGTLFLVSSVYPKPNKATIEKYTFKADYLKVLPGTRVYADYRYQSVLLFIAIMAMLIWLW